MRTVNNKQRSEHFAWLGIFIVSVSLFSQLLYSWIGYNPTDDGLILALSRRILNGEIPHKDFISIRPVGSGVLHLPFVLFSGDYCFWLSRFFVWFQFACIACLWTLIINKTLNLNFLGFEKFILSLIAFVASAHYFPAMAWHSIDGVFLISIGIALCMSRFFSLKIAGYFLIGCSYLCKQNFALVFPLSIILFNDWRKIRYWISGSLPAIVYALSLGLVGAVPRMIEQLTSHTNFWEVGVKRFVTNKTFCFSIAFGMIAMLIIFSHIKKFFKWKVSLLEFAKRYIGAIIIFFVVFRALSSIAKGNYLESTSAGLLGMVLGAGIYAALWKHVLSSAIHVAFLVALLGWSVSISVGCPFPGLAGGPMIVLLIGYLYLVLKEIKNKFAFRVFIDIALIIAACISLYAFHYARNTHVYRDMESRYLVMPLGEVFRGGKMIKTNARTYEFLQDLNAATKRTGRKPFAILPDMAGYWVKADQLNPLPIDWAQAVELGKSAVYEMFLSKLEAQRGKIVIFLEKTRAETLEWGFQSFPADTEYYKVIKYVMEKFTKFDETTHFALYH